MPAKTIGTGALLVAVGVIISILSDSDSITSYIPSFAGGVFIVLGVVALVASGIRHHVMHAAAAIALIMILASAGRMISAGASGWAAVSQILTIVICAGYVATAVGSFRAAAAARKAAEKAAA